MPEIASHLRQLDLPTIKCLYAAPIKSLTPGFNHTILYHPKENPYSSRTGLAGTFIDPITANTVGLQIGSRTVVSLFDIGTRKYHDVNVTIADIIGSYPDTPSYPPRRKPVPYPFIWVSANELAREFAFSDTNPTIHQQSIILNAHDTSKCYFLHPPSSTVTVP